MPGEDKELGQPIVITPRNQPSNRNYTLTPTPEWLGSGDFQTPPHCPTLARWASSGRRNKGTVLDKPGEREGLEVLHCP